LQCLRIHGADATGNYRLSAALVKWFVPCLPHREPWPAGVVPVYTEGAMETIIRAVRDLDSAERSMIEQLVGHALRENQQLVIQVLTVELPPPAAGAALPDWCNVFEGLSDEQVADLEQVILQRADLSRTSE
jgi:hypothetical protein